MTETGEKMICDIERKERGEEGKGGGEGRKRVRKKEKVCMNV